MRFLLGYGSCGIASGAKNVLKGLESAFENTSFKVEKVGCNGLCFAEPVCEIITDDGESVLYGRLDYDACLNGTFQIHRYCGKLRTGKNDTTTVL